MYLLFYSFKYLFISFLALKNYFDLDIDFKHGENVSLGR